MQRFFLSWIPIFVLVPALATCLSGCSGASSPPKGTAPAGSSKTFTFRLAGEPETLDWNRAHTPMETHILMNLMEGLVGLDSQLRVVPALAENWSVSPDGKTYVFKLRPGVKWSDGISLKAQDFVYSWKRLLSPSTAAAYAYFLYDVVGARDYNQGKVSDFNRVGIKALDEHTLQIDLAQAVGYWLYIPTYWVTFPLRQDVVEKWGPHWTDPEHMITLGPYSLTRHEIDSKVVLRANPHYYGERGNVEEVVGQVVTDDATALNLYESGRLDLLTDLPFLDLERLAQRKDRVIFPYLKTVYIGLVPSQLKCDGCDPLHLRKAIAMAIDKTRFDSILHGGQGRATTLIPPGIAGFSQEGGLPYDPERAKEELKLARQKAPQEARSRPTPIRLGLVLLNADRPLTVAQYIQNELKKNLGIEISIEPFDNKTYRSKLDLHEFPLYLTSWSADYPDPDNFLSVFLGDSGNNRTLWKDPRFDALVNRVKTMSSKTEREKLALEAQKLLLNENAVIIPLYYDQNIALIRPGIRGVELNPLNYLFINKVMIEREEGG